MPTPISNWYKLQMKMNGVSSGKQYSFSETYDFADLSDKPTSKIKCLLFATLRALFMPKGITIIDLIVKNTALPNKTYSAYGDPITGAYTDVGSSLTVSNNGTNLANISISNGGTPISPGPVLTTDLFRIDSPKTAVFFRFENNNNARVTRAFHGVPDFWVNDEYPEGLDVGHAWKSVTPATPTFTPAVDKNYWNNFKPFMDFICTSCILVRKNPAFDPTVSTGDGNSPYFGDLIKDVIFRKLDDAPVGKPYNLEVGRRLR